MTSPIFSATHRQMTVLRYVCGYIDRNGVAPSYREILKGTGLASTSQVHQTLFGLRERGLIDFDRHGPRSITVLAAPPLPRDANGAPLYFIPADRLPNHGGKNTVPNRDASSGNGNIISRGAIT